MNDQRGILAGAAGEGAIGGDEPQDLSAAIYARTSSTSQEFGYSIGEQVRQCVKRCEVLDWSIDYVFRDEAISGKDTDRPMFQEMLSRAEEGAFDVLVFWKLDRFSRSIMHAVQLEKEFREWGVSLHSVTEQIDTTTPAGRFNFRNIANAAEFERELITQRSKMGHRARAMEHKWPNDSPPVGYNKDNDGRLQIDERESEIVNCIFDEYIQRKSMPSVVEYLNEGVDTHNQWTKNDVNKVLKNKLYIGEFCVGGFSDHVEEYRIISDEIFDQAERIRMRFQRPENCGRPDMSDGRKSSTVNSVLSEYMSFLT